MTARKLKNRPYCARLDQPGRGPAEAATAQRSSGGLEDAAELLFLERPAGAERDAGQRILGDGDRQAGLVAQHFVEALQQRAAAGEDDALVADVGGELGRGVLERDADAFDDRADRLATAPRRSGPG